MLAISLSYIACFVRQKEWGYLQKKTQRTKTLIPNIVLRVRLLTPHMFWFLASLITIKACIGMMQLILSITIKWYMFSCGRGVYTPK